MRTIVEMLDESGDDGDEPTPMTIYEALLKAALVALQLPQENQKEACAVINSFYQDANRKYRVFWVCPSLLKADRKIQRMVWKLVKETS